MTKAELLTEAGRRLGDTSANFLTDILDPAFDYVLRDLAQAEAIGTLRRSQLFHVEQDVREYDVLHCTQMTLLPARVLGLTVYGWGTRGAITRADPPDEVTWLRLRLGEEARGPWQRWRLWPNGRTLEVCPPAGADDAGVECEILFDAQPRALADSEEIPDILEADLETLVYGLQMRLATFGEDTAGDFATAGALYVAGRDRMFARRFNSHVGRVMASPC